MAKPNFSVRDVEDGQIRIIGFDIPGGVTTPEEFAAAVETIKSQAVGEFGVIIDGRGPVWGYAMIIHKAHPTKWIATRDPRIGAIVVASHDEAIKVGQVIPFPA